MTTFIDYNILSNDGKQVPADFGYHIVPIYKEDSLSKEKELWIINNLHNGWTCFWFGVPCSGMSYCFESTDDAMAFKLKWV